MGPTEQRVWELLSGLRARAEERRRSQGLPSSQATVETELRASAVPPGARGFSRKRINDWAPRKPSAFNLPQSASDDKVVALAALWAAWAAEPAPGRELRNLLGKARDEQLRGRRTPREEQAGAESGTESGAGTVAETARELTGEQLEVHPAPLPAPRQRRAPALPPYLHRELDRVLREEFTKALAGGPSALLVLTGESTTGKTRALYEAVCELAPDQPLLRPATARELLTLLAEGAIRPGSVLWLNEFQRILYDAEGERAAAELRLFLERQPGVVAVATLWQNPYWTELTAQGKVRDPYPHARALLVGARSHRIRVPAELSAEELAEWRKLGARHRDDRMEYAARAGATDGRVVQHLSGGPELLDAYLGGPSDHFTRHEHALLTAALDAHRLGHSTPLSADLLADAADGTLAPHHRAAGADWAAPLLDGLTDGERGDGTRTDIRCTLAPLKAHRDAAGTPPRYEPTDYLRQHVPHIRAGETGSPALWEALCRHTTDLADLERLQDSAWRRGLFRYAVELDRKAALAGSGTALVRVVERTAQHPNAALIARRTVEAADVLETGTLDTLIHGLLISRQHFVDLADTLEDGAVDALVRDMLTDRLFAALNSAASARRAQAARGSQCAYDPADVHGFQDAIDALAHRLIARCDPADVKAVTTLAARLLEEGVSSGTVHALVESLVPRVARIAPRDLAHALPSLRQVAAEPTFRALARHAVARLDLTDTWATVALIQSLDQNVAPGSADTFEDVLQALATRIVTEAASLEVDRLPLLMAKLSASGAPAAVRALVALGVESRIGLHDALTVLCQLGILRGYGTDEAVRTFLDREPARHVEVAYVVPPPHAGVEYLICHLLDAFQHAGRLDEFATLAHRAAAGMSLEKPSDVASLVTLLHSAGQQDALSVLLRRDVELVRHKDLKAIRPLLLSLRNAGAVESLRTLTTTLVDEVDLSSPEFVQEAAEVLVAVGAEQAVDSLVTRCISTAGTETGLGCVLALDEAGVLEAARRLALHQIAATESTNLFEVSSLAQYCHQANAPDAMREFVSKGLAERVGIDGFMDNEDHANLLRALAAAGADEASHRFATRAATGLPPSETRAIAALLKAMTATGQSGPREILVRRAAADAHLNDMTGVARILEALMAAGANEAVQEMLGRDPASQADLTDDSGWGNASLLLSALRKADPAQAERFARRARAAGRLPLDPALSPYGLETDGSPAAPWSVDW